MKKIILFIFFTAAIYAQVPSISPLADLEGYKTLRFGMTALEAENKITNYNTDIHAYFLEELAIKTNTIARIYQNTNTHIAYYLFFYNDYLYRIDISSYIGVSYEKLQFTYPVEASVIEEIKNKLTAKYGNMTKADVKYYYYKRIPFEEYIYWWTSDIASISLNVKPDLDTLTKTVKLYSYRISFYDDIVMKYKIYTNN